MYGWLVQAHLNQCNNSEDVIIYIEIAIITVYLSVNSNDSSRSFHTTDRHDVYVPLTVPSQFTLYFVPGFCSQQSVNRSFVWSSGTIVSHGRQGYHSSMVNLYQSVCACWLWRVTAVLVSHCVKLSSRRSSASPAQTNNFSDEGH